MRTIVAIMAVGCVALPAHTTTLKAPKCYAPQATQWRSPTFPAEWNGKPVQFVTVFVGLNKDGTVREAAPVELVLAQGARVPAPATFAKAVRNVAPHWRFPLQSSWCSMYLKLPAGVPAGRPNNSSKPTPEKQGSESSFQRAALELSSTRATASPPPQSLKQEGRIHEDTAGGCPCNAVRQRPSLGARSRGGGAPANASMRRGRRDCRQCLHRARQ